MQSPKDLCAHSFRFYLVKALMVQYCAKIRFPSMRKGHPRFACSTFPSKYKPVALAKMKKCRWAYIMFPTDSDFICGGAGDGVCGIVLYVI